MRQAGIFILLFLGLFTILVCLLAFELRTTYLMGLTLCFVLTAKFDPRWHMSSETIKEILVMLVSTIRWKHSRFYRTKKAASFSNEAAS